MAISYGPTDTRNGLLLHWESTGRKAWRGRPSINAVFNTSNQYNFGISGLATTVSWSWRHPYTIFRVQSDPGNTNNAFRQNFDVNTLNTSSHWQVSYKKRTLAARTYAGASDWNDQVVDTYTEELEDGYTYYWHNAKKRDLPDGTPNYTATYRFLDWYIGIGTLLEVKDLMVEAVDSLDSCPSPEPYIGYQRPNTECFNNLTPYPCKFSLEDYTDTGTLADPESWGITFDGVDDKLISDEYTDELMSFTGNFTIEAWVRHTNASQSVSFIAGKGTTGGVGSGYWIGISGNSIDFHTGTDQGATRVYMTNKGNLGGSGWSSVPRNEWIHVVGTYDGYNVRGYINGVIDSNATNYSAYGITYNNTLTEFRIGDLSNDNSRLWTGDIGMVKTYERVLDADEIRQNYETHKGRFS